MHYLCVTSGEKGSTVKVMLHLNVFLSFYKVMDPQEQAQDLSSVNPQYENVPAPPQSVLSMKECAAYGVIEGTRF